MLILVIEINIFVSRSCPRGSDSRLSPSVEKLKSDRRCGEWANVECRVSKLFSRG